MKLYYSKGACSLVVRIIINELSLPCEYESVNLKNKKTQRHQDFLSINPKGSVPVLCLEEGELLTENTVILQYLAEHYPSTLLPLSKTLARYQTLEWLSYISTELHKSFANLFLGSLSEEVKEKVFLPLIKKKFDYVNQALEDKPFLLKDHFSLADAYLFVILRWCFSLNIDIKAWPHLYLYYEGLLKRPAIHKSLQEEHLLD